MSKLINENKINDYILNIPDITPKFIIDNIELEETVLNAQILNKEECQKLIFKKIKIYKNFSFYKIKLFITDRRKR